MYKMYKMCKDEHLICKFLGLFLACTEEHGLKVVLFPIFTTKLKK